MRKAAQFIAHRPVGLESHRIDTNVRAAAARQVADRLHDIYFVGIQRLRLCRSSRRFQPVGLDIDADHSLRSLQPRDFLRHQSHRPAARRLGDGSLAALWPSPVDPGIPGGQNIREEQQLFVREIALHLARTGVCIGHAHVLSLASIVTAVEIGIAEKRASLWSSIPPSGPYFSGFEFSQCPGNSR